MTIFQAYKINDLFHASNGNTDIQQCHINGFGYYVVSSGIQNYGIIGKSDIAARIFDKNTITIDMFGNAYFRDYEYKMVTHARVFSLKYKYKQLSKEEGLYITTLFYYLKRLFSYSKMATWEKIKNLKITLPVKSKNQIDYKYMEEYIRKLEEERMRELTVYLKASGLENYQLTDAERQAIEDFENKKINYANFKLGEGDNRLFDITTTKKKFNADSVIFGGKYAYVARGSANNGIRGYITEDEQYLNNAKTISFGQDTATMFYQSQPYFTGDKIKIMTYHKKELDENLACYLITAMKKAFQNFAWGQSSFKEDILKNIEIPLPITNNGNIYYDFIKNFIMAQKKNAIDRVVKWRDNEISATKQNVG